MALLFYGKTECPLCGKVVNKGQDIVSFPAFVGNELDPLWMFNDASFHAECFNEHPLAQNAKSRYAEIRERQGAGNRFCVVCKQEIRDPDDYFAVGHLVEDVLDPLYLYNYTQAHRTHFTMWAELPYFYELLVELKESGAWSEGGLDRLLADLRGLIGHID
jgi:hypothetical protein